MENDELFVTQYSSIQATLNNDNENETAEDSPEVVYSARFTWIMARWKRVRGCTISKIYGL